MTSIRMKLTPHLKLYTVRSRQLANVFGRIIVMFQGLSMHLANEIANSNKAPAVYEVCYACQEVHFCYRICTLWPKVSIL